jgi:protein-disulfide isomerase
MHRRRHAADGLEEMAAPAPIEDHSPVATIDPLDETVDHIRGPRTGRVILEYGDYECPYSRRAFREIERVEQQLGDLVRFAFRHFPLMQIHPHAASAAAAAEAASIQGKFWEMHELLFHHQNALEDDDLRRYATQLDLELDRFDRDRAGDPILRRVARDLESGTASGQVLGTPTLFIDGVLYGGSYETPALVEALAS